MSLTRIAVWALIAGLCVAAAAAIAALLTGDFSDTHTRIIGTSLGFSAFTGIGAVGDALRREATGWRAVVGSRTGGSAGSTAARPRVTGSNDSRR